MAVLKTTTINGGFELYHATPYIDFHYNNTTDDYDSRIINSDTRTLDFDTNVIKIRGKQTFWNNNDNWLRINDNGDYTNGVYVGSKPLYSAGIIRANSFQVDGGAISCNGTAVTGTKKFGFNLTSGDTYGVSFDSYQNGAWKKNIWRCDANLNNYFYGQANTAASTSDERTKKDISTDLSKYEKLYMDLKPISFKYNEDMDMGNATHFGFGAQTTIKVFKDNNMDWKDTHFVLEQDAVNNENKYTQNGKIYRINYMNMVGLNTYMIQKLTKRIEELEQKVNNG